MLSYQLKYYNKRQINFSIHRKNGRITQQMIYNSVKKINKIPEQLKSKKNLANKEIRQVISLEKRHKGKP